MTKFLFLGVILGTIIVFTVSKVAQYLINYGAKKALKEAKKNERGKII